MKLYLDELQKISDEEIRRMEGMSQRQKAEVMQVRLGACIGSLS